MYYDIVVGIHDANNWDMYYQDRWIRWYYYITNSDGQSVEIHYYVTNGSGWKSTEINSLGVTVDRTLGTALIDLLNVGPQDDSTRANKVQHIFKSGGPHSPTGDLAKRQTIPEYD